MTSFDNQQALHAYERDCMLKHRDEEGRDGALARALPVHHAFREWFTAEIARRKDGVALDGALELLARLIGEVLINCAHGDKKHAVEKHGQIIFSFLVDRTIDHLSTTEAHSFIAKRPTDPDT